MSAVNEGCRPRSTSPRPAVCGSAPANPASCRRQHAAAGRVPHCCSFLTQNNSTLFFYASAMCPGSLERDVLSL